MIHYRAIVVEPITSSDTAALERHLNELAELGYRLVHAQGMLFVMEKDDTPAVRVIQDNIQFGTVTPKKTTRKVTHGKATTKGA